MVQLKCACMSQRSILKLFLTQQEGSRLIYVLVYTIYWYKLLVKMIAIHFYTKLIYSIFLI